MTKSFLPYFMLFLAVIFGTLANSFANSADGFTKIVPSVLSCITIIICMLCLSQAMKVLPVGITYASFAGVCIIATSLVGIFKFSQVPNMISVVGLSLILVGVLIVNTLGQVDS